MMNSIIVWILTLAIGCKIHPCCRMSSISFILLTIQDSILRLYSDLSIPMFVDIGGVSRSLLLQIKLL